MRCTVPLTLDLALEIGERRPSAQPSAHWPEMYRWAFELGQRLRFHMEITANG